jgi:hypothetical protein
MTVLALLPRGEWFGGGSPPARYLVPLLPLMLLAMAELVSTRGGLRLTRAALPWAAVAAWIAATRPLMLFNPTDGGWWLADRLARALHCAAVSCFPTMLRAEPAALVVPIVMIGAVILWTRSRARGAAGLTIAGLALVIGIATGLPERRAHAEDPQVRRLGGSAHPPQGTFFRARHGISWRLPPGKAIEIPWSPPAGQRLVARVRVDGSSGSAGVLSSSWDDGPMKETLVGPGRWRRVAIAEPIGPGPGLLRLQWRGSPSHAEADVLIDLVEADRR